MDRTSELTHKILSEFDAMAVVGLSADPTKAAHSVPAAMQAYGWRVIPVNPHAETLLGERVYRRLADIPEPVDMVDIFRASEHVLPVVKQALALTPKPQVIWMQLTIRNEEAAKLAEDAGLKVVMNRCPKIEYGRLSSEISWIGVNSRTLSSKRAQIYGKGVQRMGLNERGAAPVDATAATGPAQKSTPQGG